MSCRVCLQNSESRPVPHLALAIRSVQHTREREELFAQAKRILHEHRVGYCEADSRSLHDELKDLEEVPEFFSRKGHTVTA